MDNKDLAEKLRALEDEVDMEIAKKNLETTRIWNEFVHPEPTNTTFYTPVSLQAHATSNASAQTESLQADINETKIPQTISSQNDFCEVNVRPDKTSLTDFTEVAVPQKEISSSAFSEVSPASVTASEPLTMEMLNAPVITKDDFSDHQKWAVVLAGGGGKGSYQIGVWKALMELKVWEDITAVSGASVGSLNAALMSLGDYNTAENIWKNIMPEQFLDIQDSALLGSIDTLFDRTRTGGICSRDGLIRILNSLPLEKLMSSKIPAYACVTCFPSENTDCLSGLGTAEYISLSEVDTEDAKKLLLASSAMPYIYPPEIIHGKVYRDGGLADNVPVLPMTTVFADKLIVVKLDKNNKIDRTLYNKFNEVIEITPSHELGDLIDGTLDFDSYNVDFRLLLGYYDTLRAFGLRMYKLNNLPLSQDEVLRRENEDFEKVLSEVRRIRAISSADSNLSKINKLIGDLK